MIEAKLLSRREVFKGRVVDLSVDRVRMPNGKTTELEVIRHPGAAAMVPLTDSGEVLLVRQYRYATGGWLVEVPAGKLDEGEEPEICAARELEEEVGMKPTDLVPLGWIWTTPGFTDERIWLYLCRGLVPAQQDLEDDEVLTVESRSLPEAIEMVQRGEICDGKSVCALLRAETYLRAEG
jgi:ADP-ribose pyrophosphatase